MGRTVYLVIGMAGSGKTSLCRTIYNWLNKKDLKLDRHTGMSKSCCTINLDPATIKSSIPYNIDITEVIDYEEVMREYNLGPNGAITTCLNLFLLKIDEFIHQISGENVIIDTPGQIEAFTWSSSGLVLVQCLKTLEEYKTVLIYTVDSEASQDPQTFMANMIYAGSLKIRYNVPILLVFNKSDLGGCERLKNWLQDYECFRGDLDTESTSSSMMSTLSLYLEEFYKDLNFVNISCLNSVGENAFFEEVSKISAAATSSTIVEDNIRTMNII